MVEELVKTGENSGLWRSKRRRTSKSSMDEVMASLKNVSLHGSKYQCVCNGKKLIFQIGRKSLNHVAIERDGVDFGSLDFPVDELGNIDWQKGSVTCQLVGFPQYMITKRRDSLWDSKCNQYYEFQDGTRIIAKTTIDLHSYFKLRTPPIVFQLVNREVHDPDPWLIALITRYVKAIDGRFEASSM